MSELGETFKAFKEAGKVKKQNNLRKSIAILDRHGVIWERFDETHYRIGVFDFWPSTGKFWNRKTNKKGRGVFSLLRALGVKEQDDHDK